MEGPPASGDRECPLGAKGDGGGRKRKRSGNGSSAAVDAAGGNLEETAIEGIATKIGSDGEVDGLPMVVEEHGGDVVQEIEIKREGIEEISKVVEPVALLGDRELISSRQGDLQEDPQAPVNVIGSVRVGVSSSPPQQIGDGLEPIIIRKEGERRVSILASIGEFITTSEEDVPLASGTKDEVSTDDAEMKSPVVKKSRREHVGEEIDEAETEANVLDQPTIEQGPVEPMESRSADADIQATKTAATNRRKHKRRDRLGTLLDGSYWQVAQAEEQPQVAAPTSVAESTSSTKNGEEDSVVETSTQEERRKEEEKRKRRAEKGKDKAGDEDEASHEEHSQDERSSAALAEKSRAKPTEVEMLAIDGGLDGDYWKLGSTRRHRTMTTRAFQFMLASTDDSQNDGGDEQADCDESFAVDDDESEEDYIIDDADEEERYLREMEEEEDEVDEEEEEEGSFIERELERRQKRSNPSARVDGDHEDSTNDPMVKVKEERDNWESMLGRMAEADESVANSTSTDSDAISNRDSRAAAAANGISGSRSLVSPSGRSRNRGANVGARSVDVDLFTPEEVAHWSKSRLKAWARRHANPDSYYYRFTGANQLVSLSFIFTLLLLCFNTHFQIWE
jgi:hypothetical protein